MCGDDVERRRYRSTNAAVLQESINNNDLVMVGRKHVRLVKALIQGLSLAEPGTI